VIAMLRDLLSFFLTLILAGNAQSQGASREMIQLVRCYESAQDSALVSGISHGRLAFVREKRTEAQVVWDSLQQTADSAQSKAASYLIWALRMFEATAAQRMGPDKVTNDAMLDLVKPSLVFVPEVFPMRFSVFGNAVVMRFESVTADLNWYYDTLERCCDCRDLRALRPHLKLLGFEVLHQSYQARHKKKCRKWWKR
jgi:hypothetical protein